MMMHVPTCYQPNYKALILCCMYKLQLILLLIAAFLKNILCRKCLNVVFKDLSSVLWSSNDLFVVYKAMKHSVIEQKESC